MTQSTKTVMIVAGGTGGHVFPGIAVARILQQRNVKVIWLGTQHGLDAKLVPQAGIEFYQIPMVGLRVPGVLRKLISVWRLVQTVLQTIVLIRRLKPDTILGMGGYVTAPAGIAAWLLRKKLVIHEQNAIAGMANRYLAKLANVVLQAFPNTFPANKKIITVGNPVRQTIVDLPVPAQRFAQHHGKLRVLVIGGSLGAQAINEIMPKVFTELQDDIELYHQAGKATYENTAAEYRRLNLTVKVVEFIDDVASAYDWADIVICRAGALTVSELAAAGVPSILVPLPIAVDDHQTANAHYLTQHQAAILLPQKDLSVEKLVTMLRSFLHDRQQLISMAEHARRLAMTHAAEKVADCCISH